MGGGGGGETGEKVKASIMATSVCNIEERSYLLVFSGVNIEWENTLVTSFGKTSAN